MTIFLQWVIDVLVWVAKAFVILLAMDTILKLVISLLPKEWIAGQARTHLAARQAQLSICLCVVLFGIYLSFHSWWWLIGSGLLGLSVFGLSSRLNTQSSTCMALDSNRFVFHPGPLTNDIAVLTRAPKISRQRDYHCATEWHKCLYCGRVTQQNLLVECWWHFEQKQRPNCVVSLWQCRYCRMRLWWAADGDSVNNLERLWLERNARLPIGTEPDTPPQQEDGTMAWLNENNECTALPMMPPSAHIQTQNAMDDPCPVRCTTCHGTRIHSYVQISAKGTNRHWFNEMQTSILQQCDLASCRRVRVLSIVSTSFRLPSILQMVVHGLAISLIAVIIHSFFSHRIIQPSYT